MNRLTKAFAGFFAALFIFCACESAEQIKLTTQNTGDYTAIIWEERTYVPFCAVSAKERGEVIGLIDGEENHVAFEYAGYPAESWLIDGFVEGAYVFDTVLYREMSVTVIPEGISSEYKWNNLTVNTEEIGKEE